MGLHTAFGLLSEIIERYERRGHTVQHVDAAGDERGGLRATLELPISLDEDDESPVLSPETATMTDDGGFTVELSTAAPPLPADVVSAVSVDDLTVRVEGSEVLLVVALLVDPTSADSPSSAAGSESPVGAREQTADGPTDETREPVADGETKNAGTPAETTTALAAVRDDSLPPYEDTAYLERLYDSCETFAEMSRLIEMDVAGETVRRYMIDAGIHTPTTYRTTRGEDDQSEATADTGEAEAEVEGDDAATDDGVESASTGTATDEIEPIGSAPDEELVADGIGLPDGLHIEDVVDAVAESSTVYEVQRALDLEQQRTWDLLRQLGLLELLLGRLSDGPRRAVSHEAVTGRIRQRIANGA
jgi:hypothetical protein